MRKLARAMIATTLVFSVYFPGIQPSAAAGQSCEPRYKSAVAAVEQAAAGQGIQQKLLTKLNNAWRMYMSGKTQNALHELDVALELLDSTPTKQVNAVTREQARGAVTLLRDCVSGSQPPRLATLTVRTFLLDDQSPNLMGAPAGAGVHIRVNGSPVGMTNGDGTLTAQVPSGVVRVQALVPSFSVGEEDVTLAPGGSGDVSIVLDDSKEVVETTELLLTEEIEEVVPLDFSSFTLRFYRDYATVPLERIEEVDMLGRNGAVVATLEPHFRLAPDGTIFATDVDRLRTLFLPQSSHAIVIRVSGVDTAGFTHHNSVRFYIGRYRLAVALGAPPSNQSLKVANIPVRVTLLGTEVSFTRQSDTSGRFEIAALPIGNVSFDAETLQNGTYYYGQGTTFLRSDRTVTVVMRSVTDVVNGVSPISVASNAGPASRALPEGGSGLTGEEDERRRQEDQAHPDARPKNSSPSVLTTDSAASVTVTAASQDVPVTDTTTLSVPKGTSTVRLVYNVSTAEYPRWVLQQSIYNDVWAVSVFGGTAGMQLFQTTRNVNSQLNASPIWQSNGSTGLISETLDVSSLTSGSDVTLTLAASATNIGDSILPTTAAATLTREVDLTIDAVDSDTVSPTNGDSSYYSIPRPGATNHFDRWFTLRVTKPDEAIITRVRVVLEGPGDLMTVLDEGPGANVQVLDSERLRVRVSMHTAASAIASTPPPTHQIVYRFLVEATYDGETLDDERDSAPRHALWRMPDGLPRYGVRDDGGDDWSARAAYVWIETNRTLLTRVDDMSGEHARNIGHTTHQRGVDIDMFHFYTFPGGVSGGTNYTALQNNVLAALNGDAAAAAQVSAWVAATRTGFDNLLALPSVSRLYYAIGNEAALQVSPGVTIRLNAGWARSLIEAGSVTAATGEVLDTGQATWANAGDGRMRYNAVHNSHVHVALNVAA